jgi:hypothetical protein
MDKEEFKAKLRRLYRQLGERAIKVNNMQRPSSYYENKRVEFAEFIDEAKKETWFEMPGETTIIYKLYNNI